VCSRNIKPENRIAQAVKDSLPPTWYLATPKRIQEVPEVDFQNEYQCVPPVIDDEEVPPR